MAGINSSPLPYRTSAMGPGTPSKGRNMRESIEADELGPSTIPCSPFFTQPTQVVTRTSLAPQLDLSSSPARTIIEVPASSPFQPKLFNKPPSTGGTLANRLAPAGTIFRAPARPPPPTMKRPAEAPILISDDEDDLSPARGDIRPTAFKRQISSFQYVPEDAIQKKVKQVSEMTGGTIPIHQCREALLSCHNDVSDAVNYLLDGKHLLSKSNIIARSHTKLSMPPAAASTRGQPASPIKLATPAPSTPSPAKPKPRRRLMQGRRPGRSPPSSQWSQPAQPVKEVTPELERHADESIIILDDKDDEYDNTDEELTQTVKESLWTQALRTINDSTIEDLSAMTNIKQEDLKIIEMKRPFETIEEVNRTAAPKKGGSRKSARIAIGESLVDTIMEFTKAVNAIDEVVAECDRKANVVKREMNLWDLDFKGNKRSTATPSNDELPPTPNSMNSAKYSDAPIPSQPQFMEGHCEMRPFQLYGLNWMDLLYNKGYGCILADEMGLGKTCQVISLICHLVESYKPNSKNGGEKPWPNLIVVPPSTFSNWLVEFERFAPDLSVLAYQGPQAVRREIGEDLLANPEDFHVVLTTYTQLGTEEDIETMQQMGPNAAIFDEGHKMKNPKTKVYKDLIRIQAGWRMLLTGTPIQNNLMEMLSLLNFIDPKMFNGHMEQLKYLFSQKVTLRDVSNRAFLYGERVSRARTILEPFILQRRKHQVLADMPTKTCSVVYCDLAPSQRDVYDKYEQLFKSGPARPSTTARQSDQNNIWMQLRKAALHPQLFRRHFTDEKVEKMARILMNTVPQHELQQPELKHLIGELKNASDFELHLWCRDYPCIEKFDVPDKSWLDSGKVAKMLELIRQYRENGDRVLVFSKFAKVVEILREVLFTDDIQHCVLYGQTSVSERQDLIDKFNGDPDITAFLLTTGAGGTGINLTSANKIIIFDQSDNPQDDIQAENRAHRLGQTRDVEVIRLLTSHTIEELIYKACEKKIELANKVTGAIEDLAKDAEENLEKEVRKMMAEQLTPP